MLYITLNNNKKRLYINLEAIKNIIVAAALIIGMFYVSNQEYLTYIN